MSDRPDGSARMSYAVPADLRAVRSFVAERAGSLGLAAARTELLTVAVSELTTNTLQYTSGGGHVRIWVDDGRLICDVVDGGGPRAFGRAMPSPESVRGRGLALVERICDSVSTMAVPGGPLVRLCLKL